MSMLRGSSISPTKDKKPQLNKFYYSKPDDKQFIIYSIVSKESGMGVTSHERLLLFDSMHKTLRYYSKLPDPLPSTEHIPEGKQIIFIKKVKNFQFKSTKTTIGKCIVKWMDLNGQKKSWLLTFKSNYLMNDWIIIVNQAIKDGHLYTENRPNVSTRRVTKSNIDKYVTPFMKQTGGPNYEISRQSSVSRSNAWGDTSTETKPNENWISQKVLQKQRQYNQQNYQDKSHQSQLKQQHKNESGTNLTKKYIQKKTPLDANTKKKIGVIDEVEDQSKLSKREQNELHSQSAKHFRIQKPLPAEIQQIDESHAEVPVKYEMHKIEQQKIIMKKIEINKKQQLSLHYKKNISLIAQKWSSQPKQQTNMKWIDQSKYYPYIYSNFIKKCEEISVAIIQNLESLLRQVQSNPTSKLHTDDHGYLLCVNDGIEFRIKTGDMSSQTMNNYQFYDSQAKMRHYSNIVEYIKKLGHSKLNSQFTQIIPLPVCIVEYKWHEVFCKACIPHTFNILANSNYISNIFDVPDHLWVYYSNQSALIVDYVSNFTNISTQVQEKVICEISQQLCKQQVQVGHIKDLYLYCNLQFATVPKVQIVLKLMQRINIDSNFHIFRTLLSILWGFRSSMLIRNELIQKIPTIGQGQLYGSIDYYIKAITIEKNSQLCSTIKQQISLDLKHYRILQSDIIEPDAYIILSTVLLLLGLQLTKSGKNQVYHIKFMPNLIVLTAECLSRQISKVQQIIRQSSLESWNQSQGYQAYEQIKYTLNQFDHLWFSSQSNLPISYNSVNASVHTNKLKSQTNGNKNKKSKMQNQKQLNKMKYLSSYYRIMHYISLYKAYKANDPFDKYSEQLDEIVNQSPPNYLSYLIGLNQIKWISKKGIQSHSVVVKMLHEQINRCKQWTGLLSPFLLAYYELYAVYAQQIYDLKTALDYARDALQIANQLYGPTSTETAQKWFMLANIMMEGEMYEQALDSYQRSLQTLIQSQKINEIKLQTTLTKSRSTLLSWRVNTSEAYLAIRLKKIKVYLALGDTNSCLDQCSLCLKSIQQLVQPNPDEQLQILSTIIRCYELTKQQDKIIQMVQIVASQFCNRLTYLDRNCSQYIISKQEKLRSNVLKISLSPYICAKIIDSHRKLYFYKLTKAIQVKYEGRHNQKQYNAFLTRFPINQGKIKNQNKQNNLISWLVEMLQQLSIFSQRTNKSVDVQINYYLFQNSFSSKNHTQIQSKILLNVLRLIQAISGVIGYSYLLTCFSS